MKQESDSVQHRSRLADIFQAALARVEGSAAVSGWLRDHPLPGEWRLVAVGKAAQSMADGAWQILGDRLVQAMPLGAFGMPSLEMPTMLSDISSRPARYLHERSPTNSWIRLPNGWS